MSFAEVIGPAIELADGMALDETRANAIVRSRRFFDLWPTSKAVFLQAGQMPQPGDVFRQPDLARTLRSMVSAEQHSLKAGGSRKAAIDAVRDYFYRGEIAHKIDAFSKANDGLLRYEDMAAFRIKPEEPASTLYRGYKVYKPGFWSQGPVLLQALNMLEGERSCRPRLQHSRISAQVVETMKLAYADRDTYYGDPAMAKVPAAILLSKEYAAARRKEISPRASLDFHPGTINGKAGKHPSVSEIARTRIDDELMARDTTCVNAIDKDGVMFAATPSGAWLPSVIAGDTGIPLTQRAQSFLLDAGPSERTRRRQASARDPEPDSRHQGRQARDDALDTGRRQPGPGAAADLSGCDRVRHECAECG